MPSSFSVTLYMNWFHKISNTSFVMLNPDEFSYYEPDEDGFYYHVTSRDRLPSIMEHGIRPNETATVQGWYPGYSAGKSFFVDRGAVRFWIDRIEEHLEHSHDEPPEVVVLRFPKEWVQDKIEDEEGTKDSHRPSWYSPQDISPLEGEM